MTQGLIRSWKAHVRPITSLSWTNDGKQLLSSSFDNTLKLWDVLTQNELKNFDMKTQILNAQIHPKGKVCIVCPNLEWPILLNLETGKKIKFPGEEIDDKKNPKKKLDFLGAAIFSKDGERIYLGTESGEIITLKTSKMQIMKRESISNSSKGSVGIKQFALSKKDNFLLVNCTDRILRLYDIPACTYIRDFKDDVNKRQWKTASFSNDDRYIIGGSYDSSEHKIHVWDFNYGTVEILEGPKETIVDLTWHPVFPVIVSASTEGVVYIWNCDFTESWSAYAPNFIELQDNEEYIEKEDEFDLSEEDLFTNNKKQKKGNEKDPEGEHENLFLDIETVDKYSDEEVDELLYLPVILERDEY
eukprot:TRINITY_DN1205_c0_g1_i3.p1 TRINITY_DN1205_c0_g1~~TRINITY_DN1205_c0_g1_i3.p1  ORF type:complete len:359 (+),score=113.93 TRINITY_DN1205_c0_g1_i3:252-1328(+)